MDMNFMHTIDAEDVRQFCIHNNLYTIGDCEDYNKMLASVEAHACTPQHIIAIAKDIVEHSDDVASNISLTYDNVAFYLANDVMHVCVDFDDMLQYKNFKFNDKQDFLNYIEKRMTDYWESHNDSFSRVCEKLDSWNGLLGNDRLYQMDNFDNILREEETKPSEIVRMLDSDFNYSDDYFYWNGYGKLCSTNEKQYFNSVSYSEVFKNLIDDYANVFTAHYGSAYYNLFGDVYDIIYSYNEDDIQECMNDDYYEYLFEDDKDFFSDDDLDE